MQLCQIHFYQKIARKKVARVNAASDIQPNEIFFAVLKPFLTETAFYAKHAGRFSGFKTKVT